MKIQRLGAAIALGLLSLASPLARADVIYDVTVNTSVLAGNPGQGSFNVDFQLNDGSSGDGVSNNTATISNFTINGGSLTAGTESSYGGVTGSLGSTLAITDNGFTDFNQAFTPGSSLSFTLDVTTNVSPSEGNGSGFPDQFSFAIYSNSFGSLAGLMTIDITGSSLTPQTFGGSLGNGAATPAPLVTPAPVPEPGSLAIFGILVCGLIGYVWPSRRI